MSDPGTRRWRLDLSYDGTDFSGWAVQPDRRTVQGELELWLSRVLATDPPHVVCAGRTDAGVHARGQVAHVDLPDDLDASGDRLLRRLNSVLPDDCVVRSVRPAPDGFDARFGAVWRRYVYRLADRPVPADPLLRRQVARIKTELDLDAVNDAAPLLLGLRDFGAFCKRREGATTIRRLLELRAARVDSGPAAGVVELTVRADAFCHSMVRSIAGALVGVGTGLRDRAWLASVTAAALRDSSVLLMPAAGLTLEEVGYPDDAELAARAATARTRREAGELTLATGEAR